jgi:hypothetical protein
MLSLKKKLQNGSATGIQHERFQQQIRHHIYRRRNRRPGQRQRFRAIVWGLLLKESYEDILAQNEAYRQQTDKLFDFIREKILPDHTRIVLITGIIMVLVSIFYILGVAADAFWITTLVWGSILIFSALFFRHKTGQKQVLLSQRLVELEQERNRYSLKFLVLTNVLSDSFPEGLSAEQLRMLLGEDTLIVEPESVKRHKEHEDQENGSEEN